MSAWHHLHSEKAGLIIDVVQQWPVDWLTDDGKPFRCLADAVQAIIDVPTRYVPMGCPTPSEDGSCPGHSDGEVPS